MALTKEVLYDKHEIVGPHKSVQCREATIIKEDGVEISRSFRRLVLHSDADISDEPQETQDVCNAVWTDEVKAAWITAKAAMLAPIGEEVEEEEEE